MARVTRSRLLEPTVTFPQGGATGQSMSTTHALTRRAAIGAVWLMSLLGCAQTSSTTANKLEPQIPQPEVPERVSPALNLAIPGPDGNTVIGVLRQPPGPGPFPVVIYLHGGRDMLQLDQLRNDALK